LAPVIIPRPFATASARQEAAREIPSAPTFVDAALRTNDGIAASAGSRTDSIILAMADYLRIAAPQDRLALSVPR
jgi:hypothetical protein